MAVSRSQRRQLSRMMRTLQRGQRMLNNLSQNQGGGQVAGASTQYGAGGAGDPSGPSGGGLSNPYGKLGELSDNPESSSVQESVRRAYRSGGGKPNPAGTIESPTKKPLPAKETGLSIGSRGSSVSAFQKALNERNTGKKGYVPLKEDGIYGPLTDAASRFSGESSLEDDLNTGTQTEDTERYPRTVNKYDEDIKDVRDKLSSSVEEPDLNAITRQKREMAQSQIDVVTAEFNRALDSQGATNKEADARTRALNISGGLGGSDFATAAAVKTENVGKEAINRINQEKTARVESILADVDQRATEEYRAQRQEYLRGLEGNLDRLKEAREEDKEKALSTIKGLAASSIPVSRIKQADPETYQTLLEEFGGSELDLEVAWNDSLPDNMKIKYDQEVIRGKNGNAVIVRFGINPQTGTLDKQEYDIGVNYSNFTGEKPIEAGGVLYTRNADGTLKPLTSKTTSGSGSKKTVKSGKLVVTGEQLSEIERELENSKTLYGGDGQYVNPEVYLDLYNTWIEEGGQQKEFLLQFPPKNYVNPANNTLPNYLRSGNKAPVAAPKTKSTTGRTIQ